jgi:hypothetical protein
VERGAAKAGEDMDGRRQTGEGPGREEGTQSSEGRVMDVAVTLVGIRRPA